MTASVVNVVIGVWLFLSAFLWPHVAAQFNNAWAAGVLVVTFALAGLGHKSWARYLNAALGGWLLFSTIILRPASLGTIVNHVVCGIALVFLASIPTTPASRARVEPMANART
jgi:hypothetical protein